MSAWLLSLALALCSTVARAGTVPLPSYPLAVDNPYLSTWISGKHSNDVTTGQPQFWAGQPLTWNIAARVGSPDGPAETYTLFGFPAGLAGATSAVQQGPVNFTSTHTYVSLTAGGADFLLDFLSPVSPRDLTRQSLQYTYLTVSATSSNNSNIQIFSAIDDTWLGFEHGSPGNYSHASNTNIFEITNPKAITFTEHNDMGTWGSIVYAAQPNGAVLLSQCGASKNVLSDFVQKGNLGTSSAPSTCAVGDLYAHVHQLSNTTTTKSVTAAVGHYREYAVNYLGKPQAPYFRAKYPDVESSVVAFLNDYSDALAESQGLDHLVLSQGDNIAGSNYTDILEASVRQSYGALEVTIPADTMSTQGDNVMGFLKEISSDGNVNSVDVIYPTFPILYVLSPDWIRLLLQPILSYLASPGKVWSLNQIPHDIGDHYPNATGHNNNQLEWFGGREEEMPLQVTGAFMQMLLAYTTATKDFEFIQKYMGPKGKYLLETYGDYLAKEGLHPSKQLSTVDALPEMTNETQLAMSAAIGLSALGAVTNLTNYTQAGASMTNSLLNDKTLGSIDPGRTHFTYDYQNSTSYSVMFPLFADKLLNLPPANSFASSYDMQSSSYESLLEAHPKGLPYTNVAGSNFAIIDWNMWSATITSPAVTERLIDTTHAFLTSGPATNYQPFGTKYAVSGAQSGKWLGNIARPTVGSNFALWALQGPVAGWAGCGPTTVLGSGSAESNLSQGGSVTKSTENAAWSLHASAACSSAVALAAALFLL